MILQKHFTWFHTNILKKHDFKPEYNVISVDFKFFHIDINNNLVGGINDKNMIVPFWYEFEIGDMKEDHDYNVSFYDFVDVIFNPTEMNNLGINIKNTISLS